MQEIGVHLSARTWEAGKIEPFEVGPKFLLQNNKVVSRLGDTTLYVVVAIIAPFACLKNLLLFLQASSQFPPSLPFHPLKRVSQHQWNLLGKRWVQ